ncbi:extensin family protein [Ferrovibrio sp.]|uniref:extensin-like domain-containing protein n=1 Tax=Ferrovibrio sp. TaxID=1917215 RepID=UPI00260E43C0|nr:extensin family protein [Ferrovibrio sp.]
MTSLRMASVIVLLLAAACAPRSQQPVAPPAPPLPHGGALLLWPNRDAIQSACLNDLQATGAQFELIAQAEPGKDGCTLQNGVKLMRTGLTLNRPVELTCPMALRLVQFEQEVLLPEAQKLFGQSLAQLNHAGGFTCKAMTGNGKRISEHGHGRAIDIWGFTLANGGRISVTDHFRARGREGTYLRDVNRAACRYFSVVLGPNADAAHAKHFHWDISQWKRCGA